MLTHSPLDSSRLVALAHRTPGVADIQVYLQCIYIISYGVVDSLRNLPVVVFWS